MPELSIFEYPDGACMYDPVLQLRVCVMKAFVRLPRLHHEYFRPHWFPRATTVEICVTTSALTGGLDRGENDYPMTEDGWHCLASSPRLAVLR